MYLSARKSNLASEYQSENGMEDQVAKRYPDSMNHSRTKATTDQFYNSLK